MRLLYYGCKCNLSIRNEMVSCAFIGHRKIEKTEELKEILTEVITSLIEEDNADMFLFGSRSEFNELCYKVVTKLKERYPQIKRIEVRSSNEELPQSYIDLILKDYEGTFFPKQVSGAGNCSYIKRNQTMIDMCDVLVTYYDKNYKPTGRTRKSDKSGTEIAALYALKKKKQVINILDIIEDDEISLIDENLITEKDVEFLKSIGVETDLETLRYKVKK